MAGRAFGALRRHPRGTLRVSLFAIRYWRTALAAAELSRNVRDLVRETGESRSERIVTAETKLALIELARAFSRARRLGLSEARTDHRVAKHLSRASSHALKAAAVPPKRRRRRQRSVVRTAASGIGVALVGATVYTAWRVRSRPQGRAVT
jgi:hypothetical protein